MRAGAGLQPEEAGRELGEKCDHISAAHAALKEARSCCIDTVHLEYALCQVDAHGAI
jgi:hypothetical protein